MNIAILLDMVAQSDPDRIVVGSCGNRLSAAGLCARTRQVATLLNQKEPATVAYVGLNSVTFPVALFGAAASGIPFSPINYRAPDEQIREILSRLPKSLVVADDYEVERIRSCGASRVISTTEFDRLVEHAGEADPSLAEADEIAVQLFTSGTTSKPKAALLRHRHLTSYIISSVEFLGCSDDEAQLISVPSYHIAGIAGLLSAIYAGRRIVYLPSFEAREWVTVARRERITHAMVVPTMLSRILDTIEEQGAGLPALRHLSYGGGRMPLEVVERAIRDLPNVDLVNAYGLTETSSTISMLTPAQHREAHASDDPSIRARLTSVGRPIPAVQLEIRAEDGSVVAPGERGEIWVRGDQVAGEYVGSNILSDEGWFRTRDAGWMDTAGYLYVDGRLDDVIVRGAENISPAEIEDVIMSHAAVTDAAVVGIPDTEWGEAVASVVVLQPGVETSELELQTWVRGRLRSTKTPKVILFRDQLPYSSTGKLLRRELREVLVNASGPEALFDSVSHRDR